MIFLEFVFVFGINFEFFKRKIDFNVVLDVIYLMNCSNDESNSVLKEFNGDDSGFSWVVKRFRVVWIFEFYKYFVDVI